MAKKYRIAFFAVAMLGLLCCQNRQQPTTPVEPKISAGQEAVPKSPPVDYEAISNRLITQVAGIKEGDVVMINGGVRDLALLESLALGSRRTGAFPLLTISSDRMARKYYDDVPEKYDSQPRQLDLKLAELVTVTIGIDSNEADNVLAGVSPARLAAVAKANEPVAELFLKRNVKQISVGNDLYPTAYRAARFGISQEELARSFWKAVNSDYSVIQAIGEKVKAALSSGKELSVTTPDGTDLKVRIEGRPFYVSDGIISPEDVNKGGPAVSAYIPAGEVYCAPVAGSAEGKVIVPKQYFNGQEVIGLTLTFAAGKLTSMTGSGPGFQVLKAGYDAAGAGKELFAFIDLGINPDLPLWPACKLGNWVQAGMLTVGIGNSLWAGGDNKTEYSLVGYQPGSTVVLDGKVIIEKGVLKL